MKQYFPKLHYYARIRTRSVRRRWRTLQTGYGAHKHTIIKLRDVYRYGHLESVVKMAINSISRITNVCTCVATSYRAYKPVSFPWPGEVMSSHRMSIFTFRLVSCTWGKKKVLGQGVKKSSHSNHFGFWWHDDLEIRSRSLNVGTWPSVSVIHMR